MDTITCPISGKVIGPGEGEAMMSRRGNMWIIHSDVPMHKRHTDSSEGKPDQWPQTVNGHRPIAGPDAE
jgi:hypothetical protein